MRFQNLQNEHNMHGNDVHDTLTSGPLGLGDEVVGYKLCEGQVQLVKT